MRLTGSLAFAIILSFLSVLTAQGQEGELKSYYKLGDPLLAPGPGMVGLDGMLGARIDACIQNGVMAVDHALYEKPIQKHTDNVSPQFKGEFWGKWNSSAMLAYGYTPDQAYGRIIEASL